MNEAQLPRWADRESARSFDHRYDDETVKFWASRLVALASVQSVDHVLDVGCGTGGLAVGIARLTGARVTACDLSPEFIRYASDKAASVSWLIADAQHLPLMNESVDCVIMSLLLHRLPNPAVAVAEAARVLRPGSYLLIKTVAPEDAAGSLPYRLFPTMAATQLDRMLSIQQLETWATDAGFTALHLERFVRHRTLDADRLTALVLREAADRYPDMSPEELQHGLQQLRQERHRASGQWVELRVATILRARA